MVVTDPVRVGLDGTETVVLAAVSWSSLARPAVAGEVRLGEGQEHAAVPLLGASAAAPLGGLEIAAMGTGGLLVRLQRLRHGVGMLCLVLLLLRQAVVTD